MTSLRRGPSGRLLDLSASEIEDGLQTAWAVDASTGDDGNTGTPAHPLRTLGEFNARMLAQVVRGASTLQLVGDVLDQPLILQATRFNVGASLTVSGTATVTASGSISAVTALGPSSSAPWQVDTIGITWTAAMVTQQVNLSSGHKAMVLEVVDADTVILGPLATLASTVVSTAPTVGLLITASTLSRAMPPVVLALGQQLQAAAQVILQNLAFEIGSASNGYAFAGGVNTLLFGCEIKQVNELRAESPVTLRACAFTVTATTNINPSRLLTTQGCVVRGTGATLFNQQTGQTNHTNLCLSGARFGVNSCTSTVAGVYIQKTANPVLVNGLSGYISCTGSTAGIHGSTGNTGIGIDVPAGRVGYFSAAKPTVTGASDCRVNGTAKTYANIPFVAYDATVPTAFTGNGASIVLEA